jgi:hypothetical protein
MHATPTIEPKRIAEWLVEQDPTRYRPGGYYSGIGSDIVAVAGGAVTIDTLTTADSLRYRTLNWNGEPLPLLEHLEQADHPQFDAWLASQRKEPYWVDAVESDTPIKIVGGPVFSADGLRFAFTFEDDIAYPVTEGGQYDVPGDVALEPSVKGWWAGPDGCEFSLADSDVMVRTEQGARGHPGATWHPDRLLTSIAWLEPDEDVPFENLESRRAQARKTAGVAIADARQLAGKGKLDEAADALRSGLRHSGDDPALLNELGFLEFQRGETTAARNALSLAWIHRGKPTASGADRDDLVGRILYNLGRWSEAEGDEESAQTFYRGSLERRPNKAVEKRLSELEN